MRDATSNFGIKIGCGISIYDTPSFFEIKVFVPNNICQRHSPPLPHYGSHRLPQPRLQQPLSMGFDNKYFEQIVMIIEVPFSLAGTR